MRLLGDDLDEDIARRYNAESINPHRNGLISSYLESNEYLIAPCHNAGWV